MQTPYHICQFRRICNLNIQFHTPVLFSTKSIFFSESIQLIFDFRHKKSSRRNFSPSKSARQDHLQHHRTSSAGVSDIKFTYDERHIAKYRNLSSSSARMTPPLPDLRVDFFNDNFDQHHREQPTAPPTSEPQRSLGVFVSAEKRGSVCLNKCLREVSRGTNKYV